MRPRRAHCPIVVPDTPTSSAASAASSEPCGRWGVGGLYWEKTIAMRVTSTDTTTSDTIDATRNH
jgi:hypothetical protein